ncbi:MAG: branched-chain amino acid ABC transporter permease [Desulfurococcales archaeon]|nr:branched-chain amino acid ABC transporter permease [Desulfurococcales archaeon]
MGWGEWISESKRYIIGTLVLGGLLALVPFAINFDMYYLLILSTALLYGVYVVAWNIIGGYAGQLDLAAFAYIGLGGIVAAELFTIYGVTPWVGMFVGAGVAMILAAAIGYPTFRFGIKDVWYALMSAALVVILNNIFHLPELLGSLDHYLPSKYGWMYLRFPTYENLYWFVTVTLVVAMLINLKISHSKTGYYLRAIREDELAAEALGIDVRKYKLLALMMYAGILGFMGYVSIVIQGTYSYHTFDSPNSITIAIMGIIGGLGSIAGAFTSAVTLKIIGEYLRSTLGASIPGIHLLIYGLLLIIVGIFKPDGLAGVWVSLKKKFVKKNVRGEKK